MFRMLADFRTVFRAYPFWPMVDTRKRLVGDHRFATHAVGWFARCHSHLPYTLARVVPACGKIRGLPKVGKMAEVVDCDFVRRGHRVLERLHIQLLA